MTRNRNYFQVEAIYEKVDSEDLTVRYFLNKVEQHVQLKYNLHFIKWQFKLTLFKLDTRYKWKKERLLAMKRLIYYMQNIPMLWRSFLKKTNRSMVCH